MNELETLAKEAFERYALITTGKDASWAYLSEDRKIAWMKEVIFLMDFLASSVHGKIKPLPPVRQTDTVFAMGYNQGIATERSAMIDLIQYLKQDLKKQLEDYKQQQEMLKRQEN